MTHNLLISIFLGLVALLPNSAMASSLEVCKNFVDKDNKAYAAMVAGRKKALEIFSSRPAIAKQADQTLSKLIAAKSPIIGQWMNKRNLADKSETEIALAWRVYFAENFALRKYPSPLPGADKHIEKLIDGLAAKHLNKKVMRRFEKLFQAAKEASLKKIKSYPLSKEDRDKIIKRVSKIQLFWVENLKESGFSEPPLELFSWGVAYNPGRNRIQMGFESLRYNSDSTIFTVFAHEIGHSFDSCRWFPFLKGENPFKDVITCLRSTESVGAKPRDDSAMAAQVKKKRMSSAMAEAMKITKTCNNSIYPPIGVQADQMPESFVDWFATEVVADSKYLNRNFRQDLCRNKKLLPGSSYPSHRDRLSKIYLAHPTVKKKLSIENKTRYCTFANQQKPDKTP